MADVIGHETGLGYVAYDTEKVVKTGHGARAHKRFCEL
jgi:hypothetical protein